MLKYIGKAFIRGVPARDLTDEEADKYGREKLVKTGLYEESEAEPILIRKKIQRNRKRSSLELEEVKHEWD